MPPHPDAIGVYIRPFFKRGQGVEHVCRISIGSIGPHCLPLRTTVTAVVGFQNYIAVPCKTVKICNIAFGGAILGRRDIPVIKDDRGPPPGRFGSAGNRKERKDFISL